MAQDDEARAAAAEGGGVPFAVAADVALKVGWHWMIDALHCIGILGLDITISKPKMLSRPP